MLDIRGCHSSVPSYTLSVSAGAFASCCAKRVVLFKSRGRVCFPDILFCGLIQSNHGFIDTFWPSDKLL